MAVRAFVLITVDALRTREVIDQLKKGKRIKTVNEVLGPYDIVAEIESPELDDVTSILREDIRPVSGIRNTLTCVVVR
ncbi:MAG: Lrp/AsnC family transcriptional regulator [Dehalococcoidia bacterium]|nr:Lrp/AsnC family transcriptional regulator [Dehalococcoidia bacterium]